MVFFSGKQHYFLLFFQAVSFLIPLSFYMFSGYFISLPSFPADKITYTIFSFTSITSIPSLSLQYHPIVIQASLFSLIASVNSQASLCSFNYLFLYTLIVPLSILITDLLSLPFCYSSPFFSYIHYYYRWTTNIFINFV